jgi:hypothetical protein
MKLRRICGVKNRKLRWSFLKDEESILFFVKLEHNMQVYLKSLNFDKVLNAYGFAGMTAFTTAWMPSLLNKIP